MVKELLLDEHESCGCQCRDLSPLHCAGTFNPQRCECVCPSEQFGAEQATVNSFKTQYQKQPLFTLLSKHPLLLSNILQSCFYTILMVMCCTKLVLRVRMLAQSFERFWPDIYWDSSAARQKLQCPQCLIFRQCNAGKYQFYIRILCSSLGIIAFQVMHKSSQFSYASSL